MSPRDEFEANLDVIDHAIALVCRHAGVKGTEAEEFASSVKVALQADDCAIIGKFDKRSSFATYMTVVISRRLADHRRS